MTFSEDSGRTVLPLRIFTMLELLIVIAIIFALIAFMVPPFAASRETGRRVRCENNLKRIGAALRKYHDDYGSFPPAFTVDSEGKPLHSWRTLILPFLEDKSVDGAIDHEELAKIRLGEAWNSTYNMRLSESMPRCYSCPSNFGGLRQSQTIYKMITGPKTASGASANKMVRKAEDIAIVIEVWPPIPWMSTEDFPVENFKNAIYPDELVEIESEEGYKTIGERNPANRPVIGCDHGYDFRVLYADGSVKTYKGWKLPIYELEMKSRTE